MPLKTLIGGRSRENPSHVKFRTQLDAAIRSVVPNARVDPAAVEGMLALMRSKEISPGDALSCFKTHFREGTPDEQYNTLRVLVQFVDTDPHLANMLHMELASRRWRERFVILAGSAHPEVKLLLIATLQTWAASYRAHDIGMHYQSTLRELASGGGSFRPAGPGYTSQHTGYSAQQTGYSAQATGAGYSVPPPPPGYPLPVPAGYPAAAPGYPPYGPPGYPPQPMPPAASRRVAETVPQKLEQLVSEVEVLRGAIRTFETTLADYKAQRCSFAALSSAMEKGQRSADRCTSLQSQMESLLGNTDADEALMSRVFSTNDAVVAAVEQWGRLANQELAPDDTPSAATAGAASTSAGPSTSACPGTSAAPPAPARPPPSPIDLLLGDELPSPVPAAAPGPAAAAPFGGAAAGGAAAGGAMEWNAFPSQPAAAAPGADSAAGPAAGSAAFFAAGGVAAAAASAPVVPAGDMEGLRAQVLALASELEKERKMHKTAMDTQEAFHKQELAQVKAQAQARMAELEAALALARQVPLQPSPSGGASAGVGPTACFASVGGTAPGAAAAAPLYPSLSSVPSTAPLPPPQPPTGLSSNNPFASSFAPPASYGSVALPPPPSGGGGPFGSLGVAPPPAAPAPAPLFPPPTSLGALTSPTGAPPPVVPAPAPTSAAPPAADILNAFDDLAVLPPKSAGGAPATPPAAHAALAAFGSASAGAAGAGGSWVNFGH